TDQDDPNHYLHLAQSLMRSLDLDAVVLTLDKHGAIVLESGMAEASHIPTVARSVYDVTGAGDMMLAALAAGRANGLSWVDATKFANAAAGLEVEVFGIEPIALERIHNDLLIANTKRHGKRRTVDELMVLVRAARKDGKSVVFTNGCFDVIHAGHVSLLERSAQLGDMLIVAMNDDHSVHKLKGDGRPVNNQDRRARVLGALGCVDAVVLFNDDTPINLIETIVPDVLVKGGDYTVETVIGAQIVQDAGGRVALIDLVEGLSTTATIEKMRQN
ncbi:MAG: D-glycero-beta-D-manno-heptose 1-phosphate adenylyltransferase, partial [Phycisphaerales bacterium]|nr:D-glycero-beta-D-manno-heptose 1-phosphate adenylyltransferase [Phycisphaerales bacterium]